MRGPIMALGVALLGAAPAHADEIQVFSPAPEAVSVTIYRDLFALITETRTVDLPAGPVTLVFDGVVESLLPQSAIIAGTGRRIDESNFGFERLTRANLLRKSLGKTVMLTRTSRATGKVRQVAATLLAANEAGVVFRTVDGSEALHCSGLPETMSFERLPDDLQTSPRVSVRLDAGAAGKRQLHLSYLAHGFAWQADYLAHLEGDRMDLAGWITLRNLTDSSFRDAQVQLVAGKLNLLDAEEERGTSPIGASEWMSTDESLDQQRAWRLEEMLDDLDGDPPDVEYYRGCYPLGPGFAQVIDAISSEDIGRFPDANLAESLQRSGGGEEIEEVIVTGFRASMAVRENLADYQLYRLPAHTDLNARQSKQVAFLHQPEVKVERLYALRIAGDEDLPEPTGGIFPTRINITWRNRASDGLGEPLPTGRVRFFERHGGQALFIGDDRLADNPVDAPAELTIGHALDLGVTLDGDLDEPRPRLLSLLTRRAYLPVRLRIINAKPQPVVVEIRQGRMEHFEDLRVIDASRTPRRKAGDYLWRFEVPANGDAQLAYKVGGRIPDWLD